MIRAFSLLSVIVISLTPTPLAAAENLVVTISNISPQSISSITVTSKNATEASITNVLSGGISGSSEGQMTIAHEPDDCVFNLKITFADGTIMDRNDIDLCQADGLVVE
jgi:hypothetical protein